MNWVLNLIEKIPEIIQYVAPGFLLVNIFVWINQKKFSSSTTQIVSSIVMSSIEISLWEKFISSSTAINNRFIWLCAISFLIGVISSIIYKSRWFNNILGKFMINRTTNDSIWNDAIGSGSWVVVFDDNNGLYYGGQFRYCNKSGDKTIVALATYYVAKKNGNKFELVEQYLGEVDRLILLNINNYDKIIVSPQDPLDLAVN